ncbi:DNA starvation/stationary phase protection protein Dps [Pseudochelatococcus contaminans]|uniref:Starvation-inducible DNA-binding protein n=1 Tax=Pseudochelatococcus contaminans TaxID=1538103 RepID=A0A7W5Z3V5_9HYPH|nr:DNA starvation/stationary phase protection protein Dps [Pseudochelatococcus contaminans]MBB3809340.1 starvation-inducible DNA-binding protein [Pseudochelatococcus contaminans]
MTISTRNDLGQNVRSKSVDLLNEHLALLIDLGTQLKHAHWNVKGSHFIALHELFDKLYANVLDYTDTVAERLTALGGIAHGTVQAAAEGTKLKAYPLHITDGLEHVDYLSRSVAEVGKSARAAIAVTEEAGDAATADVFTEVTRALDKDLWFLEAHIQEVSK